MNTDRPAHRYSGPSTKIKSATAPVALDPSPAWLSNVPTGLLRDQRHPHPERGLLGWLRGRGIYARPTLAEVEAERARRGLRSGVIVSAEPVVEAPRMVLPMPPAHRTPEEARVEARLNRRRIEEALGDLAGDAPGVYALGFEVADTLRADRAEEEAA